MAVKNIMIVGVGGQGTILASKILTSGLLGDQYIGIDPGADEKNLANGDKVTSTQSAVVLENLIGQFLYGKAEEGGSASANSNKK